MSAVHKHKPHDAGNRSTGRSRPFCWEWALYLALLILTGNLSNYINQRFAWLVYVGAGIFIVLALVNLYSSLAQSSDGARSSALPDRLGYLADCFAAAAAGFSDTLALPSALKRSTAASA